MTKPKVLIVTRHFPPILNGPSIVLSRLVKHWPKNNLSIITRDINGATESIDLKFTTDVKTLKIKWNNTSDRMTRMKEFIHIPRLIYHICREVKRHGSQVIVDVTDDGPFFIATYLASKLIKVPLVVYMLDLYEEGRRSRFQKLFAKWFDRRILEAASAVLVMSERMQEHYRNKYGLNCIVIPHPIDSSEIVRKVRKENQPAQNNLPLEIVFTGHMTMAQSQSILDLIDVIKDYPKDFHLKLYVPDKNIELQLPRNVELFSLNHQEVIRVQRNADVLFLPYTFKNIYPEIIKTASPGKLPEYLAAGRPILYYGPKEAYVKWYFEKTKAALCVTSRESKRLLDSLHLLKKDVNLREKLATNALQAAKLHESSYVASIAWQTILKLDGK